jgi:cytochrome c-type biogenesis protein CcmH/NrfF
VTSDLDSPNRPPGGVTDDAANPTPATASHGASPTKVRAGSGNLGRRVGWIALLAVVVVAFAVGGTRSPSARTPDEQTIERTQNLAESVMCPTCRGQSVADSDSSSSRGIRTHIERRIDEGASDDQIRDELADRYGEDILLTPGRSGLPGLVWILPVAALVVALAGMALAFHRWRRRTVVTVTDADRALVDRALDDLPTSP